MNISLIQLLTSQLVGTYPKGLQVKEIVKLFLQFQVRVHIAPFIMKVP